MEIKEDLPMYLPHLSKLKKRGEKQKLWEEGGI